MHPRSNSQGQFSLAQMREVAYFLKAETGLQSKLVWWKASTGIVDRGPHGVLGEFHVMMLWLNIPFTLRTIPAPAVSTVSCVLLKNKICTELVSQSSSYSATNRFTSQYLLIIVSSTECQQCARSL